MYFCVNLSFFKLPALKKKKLFYIVFLEFFTYESTIHFLSSQSNM